MFQVASASQTISPEETLLQLLLLVVVAASLGLGKLVRSPNYLIGRSLRHLEDVAKQHERYSTLSGS